MLAAYVNDCGLAEAAYRDQLEEDLTGDLSFQDLDVGQSILGREPIISRVKDNAIPAPRGRERSDAGEIHRYLSLMQITTVLEGELGSTDMFSATVTTRQLVMSIFYRYGGFNNLQIAVLMDLDYSTVSRGRKRLRDKIEEDRALRSLYEKIEEGLSRIKI